MALILVLIVCLLIFGSVMIVFQSMQQGRTQRHAVDSYVRAIFIAEAGFNRLFARLQSTGWEGRWFADVPALEEDMPYAGGTYSSLISDSAAGSRTADVLVTGHHEKSVVRMVWRVKFDEQALSLFPQIRTVVFRYVEEEIPEGSRDMSPLVARVEEILTQRGTNRDKTSTMVSAVRAEPSLGKVLETVGLPDSKAVIQVPGLPALGAAPAGASLPPAPPLPAPAPNDPAGQMPVPQVNPASGSQIQSGTWWPSDKANPWSNGWSWPKWGTGWSGGQVGSTFQGKSYKGGGSKGW